MRPAGAVGNSHSILVIGNFAVALSTDGTHKLLWRSEEPLWIEQWPLKKEKLEAAYSLVHEQLQKGHIEPSTSPWNSPIFVIQKKSGKW